MSQSRALSQPFPTALIDTVGRGRRCLLVYAILAAATLSPLLWARIPPLVDYPNHLARMWILIHGTDIPELALNYSIHWRILPDLAMDLMVTALSCVMPVEQAGRLFIALTMLLLVGGTLTLYRVLHGRLEIWPICSVLFIYNAALFWGFVNCLFATGVYLFAFSGWIATRHWRGGPRILIFCVVASLLFLLHLFAFGLYGLSVITYEFAAVTGPRRVSSRSLVGWGTACLQFLPGIILWCTSLAHGGSTSTSYGDFVTKLYALVSPFTFAHQPVAFDRFIGLLISLFLIFSVVSRSLKLVPEMRFVLAAMIVAAILMPNRMSGGWNADIRLPVALPFVAIASSRLEASLKSMVSLFAVAALMTLGLRIWAVSQSWRDYDRWYAEFRAASAVIVPGSRLLVVAAPTLGEERQLPGVPAALAKPQWVTFSHMGALAVIDRAAFFPYLFTGWTTIDVTPRNEAVSQREAVPINSKELASITNLKLPKSLDDDLDAPGEKLYWRNWPETFDFVLWMDSSGAQKPEFKQLRLLKSGSFFDIYRVVRP
jgi:hypothetical protein